MQPAPLPQDEAGRLAALQRYNILDTEPEAAFDRLVALARIMFRTPSAVVSLVDADRQWFKAKDGIDATETPRHLAFCAYAILEPDNTMVVPDATDDERFRHHPMVKGDPGIRFYAGAPIVTPDGHALGTVCTYDHAPRPDFGGEEERLLRDLAAMAATEFELRHTLRKLDGEIRLRERALSAAIQGRVNESLRGLTGGIAHEFNNLFAGMMLASEAAADPATGPVQRAKNLGQVTTAIDHGAELTRQLLSYSRQQILMPEPVDPAPALRRAADLFVAVHGAPKRIETKIAPGTPRLTADPGRLAAALAELFTNALEACRRAKCEPTIAASARSDDAFVQIAVTDRGCGMDAETTRRATEPFFTTKEIGAGPGLGLSMVQGFAEQSGGHFLLDSAPGTGTSAILKLPRAP